MDNKRSAVHVRYTPLQVDKLFSAKRNQHQNKADGIRYIRSLAFWRDHPDNPLVTTNKFDYEVDDNIKEIDDDISKTIIKARKLNDNNPDSNDG